MMKQWTLLAVLAVVAGLVLGGCASGPGSGGVPAAEAIRRGAEPPPEQRWGLATRWGEARESRVSSIEFRRADRANPRALLRLYYNDRPGMEAFFARGVGAPQPVLPPLGGTGGGYGELEFGLRDDAGAWLPTWRQDGRVYVEGRRDERFAIMLRNLAPVRREIVVSVDGLDVLDGEPASLMKRGYVLQPGEEFAVEGFRTSTRAVAAFRFGSVAESYSQLRHGTDRNVGVIGIAVFDEYSRDMDRRTEANPFPRRWATGP